MSMLSSAVQRSTLGLHSLEQYEPLIGAAAIERVAAKADRVRTMRVAHISSTFYGGGVTELLTPLILDQSYLSQTYLVPTPPRNLPGRFRVGTDGA